MRTNISFLDTIRYSLTKNDRTENFYRLQYEHLFSRHYDARAGCLKIGALNLPRLSHSEFPTREEAYYAMEIGDILYPGLLDSYRYVDEGPYEWGGAAIEKNDVVFDCGANLGLFSLLAAYRGAQVYAFEPVRAAREMMERSLALNPDLAHHIEIIPAALGAASGVAEFTVLDDTLVGSSMVLAQPGRKECSSVTTVDAFCQDRGLTVDFIKADIEGAERQMLAGAQETLARDAPDVAICTYHLPDDPVVLSGLLKKGNPAYSLVRRWKKVYGAARS